jgi:sRNA-binding regulator protein Hfq
MDVSPNDVQILLALPVSWAMITKLAWANRGNLSLHFGRIAHLHQVSPTGTLMANQSAVPSDDEGEERVEGAIPSLPPSGPRKLVRPILPAGARSRRSYSPRDTPLLAHQQQQPATNGRAESSHAEAFYLQKQMHSQTLMVLMLEDGDHIEGAIEWYDTDTIKVRNGNIRILIYKAAIKYLFKAGDQHP